MTALAAWWPVRDDTATLSQLKAEATNDLPRLAAEKGCTLAGDPAFELRDLVLHAVVPVVPFDAFGEPEEEDVDHAPRLAQGKRRSEDVAEDIAWLLDADPGLLPQNVADRLGMTWDGAREALKRAGRLDLSAAITRNQDRRNSHLTSSRRAS